MHLQEIEFRHAPEFARGFDLRRPARAGRDPHLVGREDIRARRASSGRRRSRAARSRTSARNRSCGRRPRRTRASPRRRSRAPARSLPTLKVIQLPSPTSGSASPLDGIGRVRTGALCANAGAASAARARCGEQAQCVAAIDVRLIASSSVRRAPRHVVSARHSATRSGRGRCGCPTSRRGDFQRTRNRMLDAKRLLDQFLGGQQGSQHGQQCAARPITIRRHRAQHRNFAAPVISAASAAARLRADWPASCSAPSRAARSPEPPRPSAAWRWSARSPTARTATGRPAARRRKPMRRGRACRCCRRRATRRSIPRARANSSRSG